jgi:uncharacterized membrane protein
MRLPRPFKRFAGARGGNVTILAALAMSAMIAMVAFAVDMGRMFIDRRTAQSVADLAALSAADDPPDASALAASTIARNNLRLSGAASVETGTYVADTRLTLAQRFQPAPAAVANAVRVNLETSSPLAFARVLTGQNETRVAASAVAANHAVASFAIGSRLASLNGGVINQLLSHAVGGNVSLSAMDYKSLADTRIGLFDFMNSAALRAGATALTYDQLTSGSIRLGSAMLGLSDVAGSSAGSGAAARTLSAIAGASSTDRRLSLASLADLGPYANLSLGDSPRAEVATNALDLVDAIATLANGQNQAAVALDLGIPGITKATLRVLVGERPAEARWAVAGSAGTSVRTAQTRLLLTLTVTVGGLFSLIELPIYIEVASGLATLDRLSCAGTPSATLGVTPGIVEAWIGDVPVGQMADPKQAISPGPATVARAGLFSLTARAHATIAAKKPAVVTFTGSEIGSTTPKTITTRDATSSLMGSLIKDLSLTIVTAGLPISLPAERTLLTNALAAIAAPTDEALASILSYLGVGIGQADTWVRGVRCQGAVLVR